MPAGPYVALLRAGFRQQSRSAYVNFGGLLTNVFFGVVRTIVFTALYQQRGSVSGLDLADTITYVWVVQALFAVIFTNWQWDFARRVRSGDLAVDLVRPADVFLATGAFDLGRNLSQLVFRSSLPLLGAALLLDLHLPTSVPGWTALGVAFVLAALLSFEFRFLQECTAFVTQDYRGIGRLIIFPAYFLAGFAIPVDFFPRWLQTVATATPMYGMLAGPVHVAQGLHVLSALALQVAWVLALGLLCRAVLTRSIRRVVYAGG